MTYKLNAVLATVLATLLFFFPTSLIAADTSGCGQAHNWLGLSYYQNLTSSGYARQFLVHLPIDYDQNKQYGIVLAFHGSGETAEEMELDTRLSLSNFTGSTIVIYPDGVGQTWAGAPYSNLTVNQDLTFVDDMLTYMRANFCIDSTKIYATGLSNGGGFVNVIACNDTIGGQFAAFAPVAGAYYGYDTGQPSNYTCLPARVPLPFMEIHGGADTTVPYSGGSENGGVEPNVLSFVQWWAAMNNCTNQVEEDLFNNDVQHYTWTCNGIVNATQHWKVDSMKHDWPSKIITFSEYANNDTAAPIEADSLIMDFFGRFSLNTPGVVPNTTSNGSASGTSGTPSGTTSSTPSSSSKPNDAARLEGLPLQYGVLMVLGSLLWIIML